MNNCSYIYLEKVSLQYVEHGKNMCFKLPTDAIQFYP